MFTYSTILIRAFCFTVCFFFFRHADYFYIISPLLIFNISNHLSDKFHLFPFYTVCFFRAVFCILNCFQSHRFYFLLLLYNLYLLKIWWLPCTCLLALSWTNIASGLAHFPPLLHRRLIDPLFESVSRDNKHTHYPLMSRSISMLVLDEVKEVRFYKAF